MAQNARVGELQQKLEKEIAELKKNLAWLDNTELTGFSTEFLLNFLQSTLGLSPDSYSVEVHPMRYFDDVRADISNFRDSLLKVLMKKNTYMSKALSNMDVSEPQPSSREDFLRFFRPLSLDPKTAHSQLRLEKGNRKVTAGYREHYTDNPDRFVGELNRVLSKESLTERCYWEVERHRTIGVAVSYWNVNRAGRRLKGGFGSDDTSWCLYCLNQGYFFRHNGTKTYICGPVTSRVGVYSDYSAGLLSFYSIGWTVERLVTVQTTFTQPLHAGLDVGWQASAELCELNSQPDASVGMS